MLVCVTVAGTWSSRQGEGWVSFYWTWLNLDREKEKRCMQVSKQTTPLCGSECSDTLKQNKKLLFSILNWKWSESKLKVVASRSEVDLSVVEAPISDWPRWDLGVGSAGWGLHKTAWYSVVYSTRIDDPFSVPGRLLGAGDSEKRVKIQPTLISQDLGGWCQWEMYRQIRYPQVKT